jgi:hypothetical protein
MFKNMQVFLLYDTKAAGTLGETVPKDQRKCLTMPINGGFRRNWKEPGSDEMIAEVCDEKNWRQFWVKDSDGVVKNPVTNRCLNKGDAGTNRYGVTWGDCSTPTILWSDGDNPPHPKGKKIKSLHKCGYGPNECSHCENGEEQTFENSKYKCGTKKIKFDKEWRNECLELYIHHGDQDWNVIFQLMAEDSKYFGSPVECDKVSLMYGSTTFVMKPVAHPENSNAPWAPPPGKLLVLADGSESAEPVSNVRKCLMVNGDKVFHKPCVWEDKRFYWEKAPDGFLKSVVTGQCIGPDFSDIFFVKMIDCSVQGAGIIMKKTGGESHQSGYHKIVMKYSFGGEDKTRCVEETAHHYDALPRCQGANKDRPKDTIIKGGNTCDFVNAVGTSFFFS